MNCLSITFLSHITHLCCEVENMPRKNFCNKCYIPLQFSITFRWSDRGKKKFTENLLRSKVSGVLAKITNLCRGPFLEVLIHKINATKLISIYRWEIQSRVQTIDSDRSVNVVFDLCFFFLILRARSYRFFFSYTDCIGHYKVYKDWKN